MMRQNTSVLKLNASGARLSDLNNPRKATSLILSLESQVAKAESEQKICCTCYVGISSATFHPDDTLHLICWIGNAPQDS